VLRNVNKNYYTRIKKIMKKLFLILLLIVNSQAEIIKNGDIATDKSTGLIWQDNIDAKEIQKTWQEAIDYCEALSLGGYDDWRLPNINELLSITNKDKYNPSIKDGFENYKTNYYFSSSTYASSSTSSFYGSSAWIVDFKYGYDNYYGTKGNACYVRCVRSGQ
jgi:hypothetical protein